MVKMYDNLTQIDGELGSDNDELSNLESERGLEQNTSKSKKKKRKLKVLDPNAPKRPVNTFFLFCQMQRDAIKEERSELLPGSDQAGELSNITKVLGLRWKNLSDQERKVYKDLFQEKIVQYQAEMSTYMKLSADAALQEDNPEADELDDDV